MRNATKHKVGLSNDKIIDTPSNRNRYFSSDTQIKSPRSSLFFLSLFSMDGKRGGHMAFFHCETLFLKVITHFISSRQNASVKEDFARHKKKRAEIIGHDTPICVCSIFIVTFFMFLYAFSFFFFIYRPSFRLIWTIFFCSRQKHSENDKLFIWQSEKNFSSRY